MAFVNPTPVPNLEIPILSSWVEVITVILFAIPVVIQLWRIFFIKPRIRLTASKPHEYQVPVQWFENNRWSDLGLVSVFFTYLTLENIGRANAKDCSVLFRTPDLTATSEKGEFIFPQESPLLFTSIVGDGFQIKAGIRTPYEILVGGKSIPMEPTRTIAQRGGIATILLLFVIQGYKQAIVTLARDTAGLPVRERIIELRTSVDGRIHKLKLTPTREGSYEATVL